MFLSEHLFIKNSKVVHRLSIMKETDDQLDDKALRRLLVSRPAKAMRILYDLYHDGLLRIAVGLMHDQDAARDIVQDAYFYVWRHAKRIGRNHHRSIQHYLVKIVKNRSISHYHEQILANKRKLLVAERKDRFEQPIETRLIEIETTTDIRSIIERFPRREWECLTLKLDEELSNQEISARLGVGIKAVERSLTSARKRLIRELRSRFNMKV